MRAGFVLAGCLSLFLFQDKGAQDKAAEAALDAGFASITEKDLLAHENAIAAPQLEGRGSPSKGLTRAGEYVIGCLKAAGLEPGGQGGSYRLGYTLKGHAPVP